MSEDRIGRALLSVAEDALKYKQERDALLAAIKDALANHHKGCVVAIDILKDALRGEYL